jgi:O-antigen/teichoic acid export membrane protein
MKDLKQKTLSGFIYKFAESGTSQGISFVVQIILARILMPEEFGTIALLTVLMTVLDVFVTYGFGNSLVVNKKSDDLDFSTCFYFGIFLSLVVYGIVYVCSPYISQFFYGTDELDILVKVMALRLPVAAVNSVQYSHVAKAMRFRIFFYATLIGTVLSGIVGITMAYTGYGVWALVGHYLSNALFNTITLWFMADWRPKWMFSFQRLKVIYDYGWKILVVGLIDTIFGQVRSLIIAKQYSPSALAYYNRGVHFPGLGMKMIEPTIFGVLFPALSNCNDDWQMMKSVTRRVIKVSTFLVCAIMCFLFAAAKPLVVVLLTEKWLPCVVFIQIGCVAYLLRPLNIIHNCIIRASGRSKLLLKVNVFNKAIGLVLLILLMPYGVEAIAWSYVLFNYITTFVHIWVNKDLLKYGYREQFFDIGTNLMVGIVMGVLLWSVTLLPIKCSLMLFLQIVLGVLSYILLSIVFKVESYSYLFNLIERKYKI